jgi:hypothetical protein
MRRFCKVFFVFKWLLLANKCLKLPVANLLGAVDQSESIFWCCELSNLLLGFGGEDA